MAKYQLGDALRELLNPSDSLFNGTGKELVHLLRTRGLVKEDADDDREMPDALDNGGDNSKMPDATNLSITPRTTEQNQGTIPQAGEVVLLAIELINRYDVWMYDVVTNVNSDEKKRRGIMVEVPAEDKAYTDNSHGDIPRWLRLLLEPVQNAKDECDIGPSTGKWGDALTAMIAALLAMGFEISYEVKRSDEMRKRVKVDYHMDNMSGDVSVEVTNVSKRGITELAFCTNHSSKLDSRQRYTIQERVDLDAKLLSEEGIASTSTHLFETKLILRKSAETRTKEELGTKEEFEKWCGRLVDHVKEEECFLQWRGRCAMFVRFTTDNMVLVYHQGMLQYAKKLPEGVKHGVVFHIVSNESDRRPTKGRDRELPNYWLRNCAPEHLTYGVSSSPGLSKLVRYLLDVLKLSQDSLSEKRLHWADEFLDVVARTGELRKDHLPSDACLLHVAEKSKIWRLLNNQCYNMNIIQTSSTALADMCCHGTCLLDYLRSNSTYDPVWTQLFRTCARIQVPGKNGQIGRHEALEMNVRKLDAMFYYDLTVFRALFAQAESVLAERDYKYVWNKESQTMFIVAGWTPEMANPLLVLALFPLISNHDVFRAFGEQHLKDGTFTGDATNGVGAVSISLDQRTMESHNTLPREGIAYECTTTIMADTVVHTPDPDGGMSVQGRTSFNDSRTLEAMCQHIVSSGAEPPIPSIKKGVCGGAILQRYAAVLGVEVGSPLTSATKLQALILLLVELTARYYGSSYPKVLQTWDCVPMNCELKALLCLYICIMIGFKTKYVLWKEQKHALVAIYLGRDDEQKRTLIETTSAPLDINPIHAREFMLFLATRRVHGPITHHEMWRCLLARICVKHPVFLPFLYPPTLERSIAATTSDSQTSEDMVDESTWTDSTRRDFLKKSRR